MLRYQAGGRKGNAQLETSAADRLAFVLLQSFGAGGKKGSNNQENREGFWVARVVSMGKEDSIN